MIQRREARKPELASPGLILVRLWEGPRKTCTRQGGALWARLSFEAGPKCS